MHIYVDDEKPAWIEVPDEDLLGDGNDQPEAVLVDSGDGPIIDEHLDSMQRTVNAMLTNVSATQKISHFIRATKKPVDSPFYGENPLQFRDTQADMEGLLVNERTSMLTDLEDRVIGLIGHGQWEKDAK